MKNLDNACLLIVVNLATRSVLSQIVLWISFLLFPLSSHAQDFFTPHSEQTLVFQITADEAATLYQHTSRLLYSEPYLYRLVDSFQYQKPVLPVGHYLLVRAELEALKLEQYSVHHHTVRLQPGTNELRLEVFDTSSLRVNNAEITFDDREIPWRNNLQLYRCKRARQDGWLRIDLPGDTLFYQVDHQRLRPQRGKFFRTPIGYVISTPYRWAKNTYRYFKRGIGRGQWHLNWRRIWPFPRKNRQLRGYLALNKPLYRPGDTLRVKTYLTKHNGKPWNQPLQMVLTGYRNKTIVNQKILPDRPGAFTSEIVLTDTLQLDQYYNLRFYDPEDNRYGSIHQQFKLEDYQLRAADFAFQLPEQVYHAGTPIVFTASAKDYNRNPLPGASVQLLALRQTVMDIGPDSVLIADTLWNHRADLSLRSDNELHFPDSLLPPADLGILIQAFFTTAGGESKQIDRSFDYRHYSGNIDQSLTDGMWTFRYLKADSSLRTTTDVLIRSTAIPTTRQLTVELPYRTPFDPFVIGYEFTVPGARQTLRADLSQEVAGLRASGYHTGDSLFVQLNNPNHLTVHYRLYAGRQVALEGETRGELDFAQKTRSGTQYQLTYQYLWLGMPRQEQQSFRTYKKQLQLTSDLPGAIHPGQTVQVKVEARDYKDRPVKGVEMVAGSINGQFNSTDHLKPPNFSYKNKKTPRSKHRYQLTSPDHKHQSPIGEDWYRRLNLDEQLYYQLRYPEEGMFLQYDTIVKDSFYHRHPQILPFVVKDGQLQPVYLIYLNRKLIYSHLSEGDTPYAFTGRPGKNQLRIRTLNAEYRLEDIELKAGQRLIFALDERRFGYHPEYGERTTRTSVPDYLTEGEKALLNSMMFRIGREPRRPYSYLYHDSTRYYRWQPVTQYSPHRTIGPLPAQTQLTYTQTDGFTNTFLFEPNFNYEIRENRERLYADTLFQPKKQYGLVKQLPHPTLDGLALSPADILAYSLPHKRINTRQNWNQITNGGGLQFFFQRPILAVILQRSDGKFGVFNNRKRLFQELEPDYYELVLMAENGTTIRKKVWIESGKLQVLDLREISFSQTTDSTLLETLYKVETSKESFLAPNSLSAMDKAFNPYVNNGYLAGGTYRDAETNEPLIYASILIPGTTIGTVTDLDGKWSLWVPDENTILQFSYTGYSSIRMKANEADEILALADVLLDEVVVTAYRVPLVEQDNTTQGGTLSALEIRSLPSRNINALAATTAGLATSDEVNVRGSRNGATDYYVDGVRVSGNTIPEIGAVPTSDGFGSSGILPGGGLRTEFRDYGFWQPDLITDDRGEAYFQVTFPDDITRWQAYVLGMDDRKRAGGWYGETRSFQPVTAQLFLPRFLLPGDEIDLIGSSVNYTNDTFAIETRLEVDDEVLLRANHQLIDGLTDEVNYTATEGQDSLTANYTLQTGNYLEGEERSIPLYRVGTEETIGGFHKLEGDTSLQLSFDPAEGPVTIYAQPDLLHVMLGEIEALIAYPYGCNEQLSSRLQALLMKKEIHALLDKPFRQEEVVQKIVAQLRQRQRADGSWGWWDGSPRNHWMTLYVLRTLHLAKEAGYTTEAYEKGMLYLTNQLSTMTGKTRLGTIALCSEVGQNMDYARLLEPYDTLPGLNWMTLTATLIKAQQGIPHQLDTLEQYRQETLFGGHYWGRQGYGFYDNDIQYTLLAYRIQRAAGNAQALPSIRQYFTEQRHRAPGYHWRAGYRNTFEAAMIVRTVLPDLLAQYRASERPDFQQRLLITADATIRWDSLPQQITLTATKPIDIRKTGVGTTFFTAYQRRWNPRPKREEGPFVVTSELRQGSETTERLKAGRSARIEVEVVVEKSADYVLLEIPIPAGCSYGSKQQTTSYYRRSNQETYREYFREKVAIYCEHLEPGTYTYTVNLEPRFTGRFQLNPAKAEQMYFPIFYGREGMKKIRIN